jgi:glycine betaine/choline ABC-type transport system substrate-binding protein
VRNDAAQILNPVFAKLNNAISTDDMRRLNYEVDGNKRSARDIAADWVKRK